MKNKDDALLSRRGFFRDGLNFLGKMATDFADATKEIKGKNTPAQASSGLLDPSRGFLRPPGAIKENMFLMLCSKCDDCIRACPENTLYRAGPETGQYFGAPIFDPKKKACALCEGWPCAAACKTGALAVPEDVKSVDIGKARLDPGKCLAHQGEECTVCYEKCPLADDAIKLLGGVPAIIVLNCVGCGLCEYHCFHETGRGAITTLPRLIS